MTDRIRDLKAEDGKTFLPLVTRNILNPENKWEVRFFVLKNFNPVGSCQLGVDFDSTQSPKLMPSGALNGQNRNTIEGKN